MSRPCQRGRKTAKAFTTDVLTLIELGDGTFLLTSQVSQVARQGDEVARLMAEERVT